MVDHPSSVNPLLFLIHSSIHPSTPILLGDGAGGPQEPVELPGVVEGVDAAAGSVVAAAHEAGAFDPHSGDPGNK
jgi:hypothetical protein